MTNCLETALGVLLISFFLLVGSCVYVKRKWSRKVAKVYEENFGVQ
jgi:predicted transporter